MTASCAYEGSVRHRRFAPVEHDFRYPLYLVYLDLNELDEVPRAIRRRFRRADFLGDPALPLRDEVLRVVEEQTGSAPAGPVRLLTQLRHFGFSFNPVSFYYCFDAAGERVEAVLAEVTNTPWRERHSYVLRREGEGRVLADSFGKEFHVSPFLGMGGDYEWRVAEPGPGLQVHIASSESASRVFDATLSLERHELTRARVWRLLTRYPAASLAVVARIYLQALRLKLKGVRHYPHPEKA